MDTITHGIVGALIGKAFFAEDASPADPSWRDVPRTAGRVAIVSAALGAMFPDLDVFAGPLAHNSLGMISWHRTITHSLVMLPIWAVLLAVLTTFLARRLRWPVPEFGPLVLIYALALGSHAFLDVITSFGTMIWSPLDYTRVSWDWVFIIDLTLTSAALMPQMAAWAYRRPEGAARRAFILWGIFSGIAFALGPLVRSAGVPYTTTTAVGPTFLFGAFLLMPLRNGAGTRMGRAKWARAGMALVGAYLSFAGGAHHIALGRLRDFATEQRIEALSIVALPQPPSADNWAGMIATPTGVFRVEFTAFGDEPAKIRFFSEPPENHYISETRGMRDVQTYLRFARFPLFRYEEVGGNHIVQISDLSFYRTGRTRVDATSDAPLNFTYQVVYAPDDHVISAGWLRFP
jgi:membrane-bound metal-dependent hydrolase YbcI (DUF457 family)